jgi:hypothetical protein
MLNAVETALVGFCEVFSEAARGEALDAQHAESLAAACRELLKNVGDTRNIIRLSGDSPGLH